jgi:hypothetical protein
MWPIPVVVLGLLVISAGRRLMPVREPALDVADDPALESDDEPERC